MSEITLQQTVSVSADVVFRDIGGEAVLLDLDSGQYFGLNEVGSQVWSLLSSASSLESIYDLLLEQYPVEPSELERDILSLVGDLCDHGLVAIAGTRSPCAVRSLVAALSADLRCDRPGVAGKGCDHDEPACAQFAARDTRAGLANGTGE